MTNEWDWFNGKTHIKEKIVQRKDYFIIAENKALVKKEILEDPQVLFKVVDRESDCMCGGTCDSCEYEDVLFIELVVRNKSLNEQDILELMNKNNLDIFRLCRYVPFSIDTLVKFKDKVDWNFISNDYKYKKNIYFINNFYNLINWERLDNFYNLSFKDIEDCVFIDKYVPIKIAIKTHILTPEHIKKHVEVIGPYCEDLIKNYCYNIELFDELDFSIIEPYLLNCVEEYTTKCISKGYITKKYINIIKLSNRIRSGDWSEFIVKCKPDEKFLLMNVLDCENWSEYITKGTWNEISIHCNLSNEFIEKYSNYLNWNILVTKSKCDLSVIKDHIDNLDAITISKFQKLTPVFIEMCIDEYPEKLDWYYLCEFQELSEDLMRKHIDKLNWGQVSWYQDMSHEFIKEFDNKINKVKLGSNKHRQKFGRFTIIER